jgi:hypothetical protein
MIEGGGAETGGLWSKITTWFSGLWEQITPTLKVVGEWFSGLFKSVQEFLGSDFMVGIIENLKNIGTSVMSVITNLFDTLKNIVNNVLDKIKNFNVFGGGDKEAEENAKKMGWNSVEEYEKSGWKENPNKKKVEIVDEKRKQHVDVRTHKFE